MGADAGGVDIKPDDLAPIVDAGCHGAVGGQEVVDHGVTSATQEEAGAAAASNVITDDLSRVVDAEDLGRMCGVQRIGNRGVSASAGNEADKAVGLLIITDDGA
jgi:hypothetical protein